MNNFILRPPSFLLAAALLFSGCNGEPESDAYGNFTATEITVSAQADGRLLTFDVHEGSLLAANQTVGRIDSTQLVARQDIFEAQIRQLEAQQQALVAQEDAARLQIEEALANVEAIQSQHETAIRERDRTRRMLDSGAATDRELNDLEGRVSTLSAQVRQAEARVASASAQVRSFSAQRSALSAQLDATWAQHRQVQDLLSKTLVQSPIEGTVLTVMAREGELVRTGSPLFTLADLDPLTLRVYVTGDQLSQVRLGMDVEIRIDNGPGELTSLPGTVSFIASEAEFTPSTIQTRDSRADLVYAVEIRAPNGNGNLKRGMPGEVRFSSDGLEE